MSGFPPKIEPGGTVDASMINGISVPPLGAAGTVLTVNMAGTGFIYSIPSSGPTLPLSIYNGGTGNSTGDASGLNNIPAGQLTGSIADARLSGNVALLNGIQSFSGQKTFPSAGVNAVVIPAIRQISNGFDITVPVASSADSFVLLAQTQTLTNKTLTSPAIANPTITGTESGIRTIGGTPTLGVDLAAGGFKITGLGQATTTGQALAWPVPAGANTPINVQLFTTNGTWTKPSGTRFIFVICIGGGGGGGSGRKAADYMTANGGSGGSGGARSVDFFVESLLANTISVTVGIGGAGGAAQTIATTDGINGVAGGASSFGSYLYAGGGNNGLAGTSSGYPVGGSPSIGQHVSATGGGLAGASAGISAYAAGSGGGGGVVGFIGAQAGGSGGKVGATNLAGGSAGSVPGGIGQNGIDASATIQPGSGGGGGAGSTASAAGAGGSGSLYGGGGAGGGSGTNGNNSGAGGNGANGVVYVVTF